MLILISIGLIAPIVGHATIHAEIVDHKVRSNSRKVCLTRAKNSCVESERIEILSCEVITALETFSADEPICQEIKNGEDREFEVRGVWTPMTRRTIVRVHARP